MAAKSQQIVVNMR